MLSTVSWNFPDSMLVKLFHHPCIVWFVFIYLCVHLYMYVGWSVWRRCSFQHVGPRDWTRVIRLGGKGLYKPNLLVGPKHLLWFWTFSWFGFTKEDFMAALPGHTGNAHQMAESKAFCPQLSACFPASQSLKLPVGGPWMSLCVSKGWCSLLTHRASFSELSM